VSNQTQVAFRNTLEDARQAVVDLANSEYCPEDEEGNEVKVETFKQAVAFLRDAPGSPEIDIMEIAVGTDFMSLQRRVLEEEGDGRSSNGSRKGSGPSNGTICSSCRRRMSNAKAEKIIELEREVLRLRELLSKR
jgi:hypothetical protein